jgi:hypothetical protein
VTPLASSFSTLPSSRGRSAPTLPQGSVAATALPSSLSEKPPVIHTCKKPSRWYPAHLSRPRYLRHAHGRSDDPGARKSQQRIVTAYIGCFSAANIHGCGEGDITIPDSLDVRSLRDGHVCADSAVDAEWQPSHPIIKRDVRDGRASHWRWGIDIDHAPLHQITTLILLAHHRVDLTSVDKIGPR